MNNLLLVAFPFSVVLLSMLGLVLGIPISKGHFFLAVAATLAIGCFATERDDRRREYLTFLIVLIASIVIGALPVMYTVTDGASCHRPGTFLLAYGWNPIYQAEHAQMMEVVRRYADPGQFLFRDPHVVWMPRGAWIYGAVLYKVIGFVEIADSINVYLLISAFLIVAGWMKRFMPFADWPRWILSALVISAPDVIGGLFGGCCDAAVYLLMICGILSFDAFRRERKGMDLAMGVICLSLAASIKFTGLAFAILVPFVYACAMPRVRIAWSAAVASVVLVFALNASPFVTSWVNHGGPFYPAHSFDKSEKLPDNMTFDFDLKNDDAQQMGYFGRFAYAWLSKDLTCLYYRVKLHQKSFNPQLMLFTDVDGFGAVYRFFFVLGLVGLLFVKDKGMRLMAVILVFSIFLQPGKYMGYGRYVEQVYAFPMLVAIGLAARCDRRCVHIGVSAAMLLMFTLPHLPRRLLGYPYMWLMSVQNLQVVEAVRQDAQPRIATDSWYAAVSWRTDNRPGVDVVPHGEKSDADIQYGPCSGRYVYLSKEPIADFRDYACVSVNDANTIVDKSFSSKRRAGIEKYFLKEFLPRELPLIPLRLWQTARYRFHQIAQAWS